MPRVPSQHSGAMAAGSHRTEAIVVLDAPRRVFLSIGAEVDALVAVIAERLGGARATAAQPGLRDARDDAAGPARDLEVAGDLEGSIDLRLDRERTGAVGQ